MIEHNTPATAHDTYLTQSVKFMANLFDYRANSVKIMDTRLIYNAVH